MQLIKDPHYLTRWLLVLALGLVVLGIPARANAQTGKLRSESTAALKKLPLPGEVFELDGFTAFLIKPQNEKAQQPLPWVWYAPTLKGLPGNEETWMFRKFLDAGIAVAGIDVGESYGNLKGRQGFESLYDYLVKQRGCSMKPCLLARSRGGLMLYSWANAHPDCVSCIAGIYPVCDFLSYPGVEKASRAFQMKPAELLERSSEMNPIDGLRSLAEAKVPIYHIHGDQDQVVPLEQNSGELARRYLGYGGPVILQVVEGQGHNMWQGWFQSEELVRFVIQHAQQTPARK